VSNESGRNQIYVQPYPGPGPKIQISNEGGTDPIWAAKSSELFYRDGDKMMTVRVSLQSAFKASEPRVLWQGHYSPGMSTSCGHPGTTSTNYDVTPDGQRFLMVTDSELDAAPTRIHVILNWVEVLKELMHASEKS